MTTPVIPQSQIIELPGVGDRLGAALEPLLAMLKERNERAQRQQQLMTQLGQLKLQQDVFADEQKQRNEQKKAWEEAAKGLGTQLDELKTPGETEQTLQRVFATQNTQLIQGTIAELKKQRVTEQWQAIAQKYAGKNTIVDRYNMVREMSAVDPENQGLHNQLTTLEAALGRQEAPSGSQTQVVQRLVDGAPHNLLINKTNGKVIADIGEKPPSYADIIERYGTATQQKSGAQGVKFQTAFVKIRDLGANPEVREETSNAVSAIETAGAAPFNLAGIARYVTQLVAQGRIGPAAQVMVNNVFDMLSVEGFGQGGATLTAMEWAAAVRSLAPLATEDEASWQDKLARMEKRGRIFEVGGGPATRRLREAGLFPVLDTLAEKYGINKPPKPGSPSQTPATPAMQLDTIMQTLMDSITVRMSRRMQQ